MMIGLALVVVVVLMGTMAAGPLRPADPDTRLRRRRQQLHHHAERATVADVEMLLADAYPRPVVRPLTNRIRREHLDPAALWRWAEANGATALGLAVAAEFDSADFSTVPDGHEGFDPQSLRILAELNGGSLGGLVVSRIDTPRVPQERAA